MTNAPERIFIHHANQISTDGTMCLVFTSTAPVNVRENQSEYTRADISQAAIAAGYEAAAQRCSDYDDWSKGWGEDRNLRVAQIVSGECAEEIRALTPADALAVLEAVIEAQERAMVALRKIADMKPHHAGQTMNECFMQDIARDAIRDMDGEQTDV